MDQKPLKQPKHALRYLYQRAQKDRNVDIIQIYNIVNDFVKYEKIKQLEKTCQATGTVAIHALLMTEHQRKKYRKNHVNLNGHTYYLMDRRIAWSVGVVTDSEKWIYS